MKKSKYKQPIDYLCYPNVSSVARKGKAINIAVQTTKHAQKVINPALPISFKQQHLLCEPLRYAVWVFR